MEVIEPNNENNIVWTSNKWINHTGLDNLQVSVLIDYCSLAFINLVLKNKGGKKGGLTTSFPEKKGCYHMGSFMKESEEGLREELRYMF